MQRSRLSWLGRWQHGGFGEISGDFAKELGGRESNTVKTTRCKLSYEELLMAAGFRFAGWLLSLTLISSFVAGGQELPAATNVQAKLTAALIDFDRAPLVTLLEA